MRIAGFFLMLSGWIIAVSALILLQPGPAQVAFACCSVAIQAAGFASVVRSHIVTRGRAS